MAERKAKSVKAKANEMDEILATETPLEEEKEWAKNEVAEFKGKYIKAVGRRKTAVAKVRLYEDGKGIIMINGLRASQYFSGDGAGVVSQPLKATGHSRDYNFSILAQGGGKQGQIGAVRLGIARAIFALDPAAKEALKANDFLTRDPRRVERKKPGLRKARKSPQWSKR